MNTGKLKRLVVMLLASALLLGVLSGGAGASGATENSNRFNVVFVTDASGSMKQTDPAKNRFEAINLFTNLLAERGNYLGGVVFSTGIDALESPGPINSQTDKDKVTGVLASVEATGSWTNIGEALTVAVDQLCEKGDPALPSVIVFLSDGNTDMADDKQLQESLDKKAEALQKARENQIAIYSVCLNANQTADTSEMRQLATATGGNFQEVTNAADLREVFNAFYDLIYGTATMTLVDDVFPASGILETEFEVPGLGVEEVNIIIYGNTSNIAVKQPDGSEYPAPPQKVGPFTMLKLTGPAPGVWKLITTGVPGDQIKINMVFNTNMTVELQLPGGLQAREGTPVEAVVTLSAGGVPAAGEEASAGYSVELTVMDAYENEVKTIPMEAGGGQFRTAVDLNAGSYYFRAHVTGNSIDRDSRLVGPLTVTSPDSAPEEAANTPPSPVKDRVTKNLYVWPFQTASFVLDMKELATDKEDSELRYAIMSSSFFEGLDYSVDQDDVLSVEHFSLSKGAFTIRATDSGGLSCEIEVVVRVHNIGVITAILVVLAALVVLVVLGIITYRSLLVPFMGTVTVENIETGRTMSLQKSRGRLKLSSLQVGATGLGRDCYFQASAKRYVTFVSRKPVYVENQEKPVRKVKIEGHWETKISADPDFASGVYVRFDSILNDDLF